MDENINKNDIQFENEMDEQLITCGLIGNSVLELRRIITDKNQSEELRLKAIEIVLDKALSYHQSNLDK